MAEKTVPETPDCACGCGQPVKWNFTTRRWGRFLFNHHARIQPTGEAAHNWKNGTTTQKGYVMVQYPGHPKANAGGYVRRAILVAEGKLGRPLKRDEVVHHVNAIRDDDSFDNIDVIESQSEHFRLHHHTDRVKRRVP